MQPLIVLCVEDNPADLELCRIAIDRLPITLHAAGSLAEARSMLDRGTYDCAWVDLQLPDGPGMHLIEWLASTPDCDAPAIVLTGSDDPDAGIRAVRAGAQDYMVKGRYTGAGLYTATRFAIERARNARLHRKLQEQQRVLEFGQLAAGAAHRLYNPVTSMLANQRFLLDGLTELARQLPMPSAKEVAGLIAAVRDIGAAAHGVADIVRSLEAFARSPDPPAMVDLNETVRTVARALDPGGRRVQHTLHAKVFVRGPCADIELLVKNLVRNALESSPDAEVRVTTDADAETVALVVEDDGPGVPSSLRGELFVPFFSTHSQRNGLGLSLACSIANQLDGSLELDSLSEPTRFIVRLAPATLLFADVDPVVPSA